MVETATSQQTIRTQYRWHLLSCLRKMPHRRSLQYGKRMLCAHKKIAEDETDRNTTDELNTETSGSDKAANIFQMEVTRNSLKLETDNEDKITMKSM